MLRHALSKSGSLIRRSGVGSVTRSYAAATSKQKRGLTKKQLMGVKADKNPGTPTTPPNPPPPAAATAAGEASGGGDSTPIVLGVGALAAAGAAYYYYSTMEESEETTTPEPADEKEAKSPPAKEATKETTKEAKRASVTGADGGNRVIQIEAMKEGTRSSSEIVTVSHPEGGNKVTMESFQTKMVSKEPAAPTTSVADNLKELQASLDQESSDVLKRAQREVMQSFDESLFEGLDDMTPAQLKARIMQLATEMKERTRWEALRLKEFLALKEKETGDKYLDVLQKQKLEFESILARRLREQEHELMTQSNSRLQEKDSAVKEMVDNAIQKLGEEHENEKSAMMERTDQEMKAKYEKIFTESLQEFKQKAVDEMERKQQALEALSKKLQDLENALASSQNYHEGSLQAHRLSAAALALAEKMESNKGAETELKALKAVAGNDKVIGAALASVPASMAKGVPTLPELQARFESVASKTRQAALVPAGQVGLEGQLAGMLFATLKFPPKPDDPPPEDDKDAAEYVLVRARQHVKYGELEKAIQQLDRLEGQAAFTVQGWKKDAMDRVAVEQALKVIKMECAVLNESMSKHP